MAQSMDRRRFLAFAAGSVVFGAFAALNGCSSGSNSDSTPTTPTTYTDKNAKVSSNHGHNFTLTAAQQQAAADARIYSNGGTHSHKIIVKAADVAAIAGGATWSGESSTDAGHSHIVTFN
jgi:hypothetical protein